MSSSLSAERDRIQRQVEELEQSLSVNNVELDLLSSETDSDDDDDEEEEEDEFVEPASLMEQRETIQREIRNLENVLGESCVDDSSSSSSSDESDLGLSLSVESCLQMNLVYQQVLQETLDQLEKLLTHNAAQQVPRRQVVEKPSGALQRQAVETHRKNHTYTLLEDSEDEEDESPKDRQKKTTSGKQKEAPPSQEGRVVVQRG